MLGNPCFQPLSRGFQTFSKHFDPKTGFFDSKTGFFDQKQEIISELFLQNFCEFKKFGFFRKISKLRKPNISETLENEKFRNFRLTQGIT